MNERVFVTGGVGFVGAKLAERWARDGAHVTVFDNFHQQVASIHAANRRRLAWLGVDVIEGDVRDRAALDAAIDKAAPDIVYHLAAETGTGQSHDVPARYADVNVTGTAKLLEALKASRSEVRRVILAGSRAVYGEGACIDADGNPAVAVARKSSALAAGDFAPKDRFGNRLTPIATDANCPANPTSIYATTKLMQEYILQQGFWGSGTEVGILRLQNVYGPGQALGNPYTGVLTIFAQQIAERRILDIYEDGEITRDFVYVDDVVAAFFRMGTVEVMPEGILDIGSGEGTTIVEAARRLLLNMCADDGQLRISGGYRPGDIRHAVADNSRARLELGWQPEFDLVNGMAQLTAWLAEATSSTSGDRNDNRPKPTAALVGFDSDT